MPKIYYRLIKTIALGWLLAQTPTYADGFSPLNIINPGKWFNRYDDNYDQYDELPPAPPPTYGSPYGAPPPVAPGYLPPTYVAPIAPIAPVYPNYTHPAPPSGYGYVAPNNNYPATPPNYYNSRSLANYKNADEPSREEISRRIRELEERLEKMEAKSRQSIPAAPPDTPPPATYEYYSGDQTPGAISNYPFRPLNKVIVHPLP